MFPEEIKFSENTILVRKGFHSNLFWKIMSFFWVLAFLVQFSLDWIGAYNKIVSFFYLIFCFYFSYGIAVEIELEKKVFKKKQTLFGIQLSCKESKFREIKRDTGCNKTSEHSLYIITEDDGRIELLKANKFLMDHYWDIVTDYGCNSQS